MDRLKEFKFWCYKVIPLVYDDSLSYYEVLCKVVKYLNGFIEKFNGTLDDLDELKSEVRLIEEWINNFDTGMINEVIDKYIATMVFFGLTDSGYFVAYIPDSWDNVDFKTTGLDVEVDLQPNYGHLVLEY